MNDERYVAECTNPACGWSFNCNDRVTTILAVHNHLVSCRSTPITVNYYKRVGYAEVVNQDVPLAFAAV